MVMVRQFDEEAVLEKVLETFWASGWQATSMADLAGAANVQRGSLYHAYGDKEQLFLLAFERYAAGVLQESRTALAASTAAAALQGFLNISIASMTAGSPPRGCFTTKTAIEGSLIGQELRDRVRALLEQIEVALTDALGRKKIRGELAIDPDQAAQLIITFTRGLAVMEQVYHNPDSLKAMSRNFVSLLVKPRRSTKTR